MAQGKTKTLHAQTVCKLPSLARRLIEKNKQRRISLGGGGGDFRGRLDKTISYLRWKASCNTLHDAIGYISSELERERLYALYQKLFAKEWKKSSASFKRTGYNEYHTERELEFIELVSDRFFPLCSWLDWSDFRFDHIPIEPPNFDLCCGEYEWQEFRPVFASSESPRFCGATRAERMKIGIIYWRISTSNLKLCRQSAGKRRRFQFWTKERGDSADINVFCI